MSASQDRNAMLPSSRRPSGRSSSRRPSFIAKALSPIETSEDGKLTDLQFM